MDHRVSNCLKQLLILGLGKKGKMLELVKCRNGKMGTLGAGNQTSEEGHQLVGISEGDAIKLV